MHCFVPFYLEDLSIQILVSVGGPRTNSPWILRNCGFQGDKTYTQIFDCAGMGWAPQIPTLFKGQLYMLSKTLTLDLSIVSLGKPKSINHQHKSFQVRALLVFLDLLPTTVNLSGFLQTVKQMARILPFPLILRNSFARKHPYLNLEDSHYPTSQWFCAPLTGAFLYCLMTIELFLSRKYSFGRFLGLIQYFHVYSYFYMLVSDFWSLC